MSTEATKAVLNSPCVDRYGGKCLSKDNSKAVPSDRFGKPKHDKKRPNNAKGKGNNDNGPSSKKNKGNNKPGDGNKKVRFLNCLFI